MKTNAYNLFFMALANQGRMKIIEALQRGVKSVNELAGEVGLEQSHVSHHLKCLTFCGFVRNTRDGKKRMYSLNEETMRPLLKLVEQHIKKHANHLEHCKVLKY